MGFHAVNANRHDILSYCCYRRAFVCIQMRLLNFQSCHDEILFLDDCFVQHTTLVEFTVLFWNKILTYLSLLIGCMMNFRCTKFVKSSINNRKNYYRHETGSKTVLYRSRRSCAPLELNKVHRYTCHRAFRQLSKMTLQVRTRYECVCI